MLMKKTLLSRRGVAIEMAIGVMLIMLAVSIILLSLVTIKVDRQNDDLADLNTKVTLDEIGEYVCENRNSYDEGILTPIEIDGKDTGYSVTKSPAASSTNINLIITENGENATVLDIWLDADGNIISWK